MVGIQNEDRLKQDICEDLGKRDINTRGKRLREVQELATVEDIPVTIEVNDIKKSQEGKLKGICQVLW